MAPQTTDTDFSQWNIQKAEGNSQSFHSASTTKGMGWRQRKKQATKRDKFMHIFMDNFRERVDWIDLVSPCKTFL